MAVDDPRWTAVADLLVTWSTNVQPGERVLITMVEPETYALACAVHASVIAAGGIPHVEFQAARLERDLLALGSPAQAGRVPEMHRTAMAWADVSIALRGATAPDELEGASTESIAARRRAMGIVSALRTRTTRWVIVRVPGESLAAQAGMSLAALTSLFFEATLRDWEAEAREYRRAVERFDGAKEVRIVGRGTDLRLSIEGRKWMIEDGHVNIPGGEIYTSPVETSVEGQIAFEHAAVFAGRSIAGIKLRFEAGIVVDAHADSNEDLLADLLGIDAGSRRVGELGFGMNPAITELSGDSLLDEKVAGTVHVAIGRSYEECGGLNRSALHWDIVKDLRADGHVLVDGRPMFVGGRFVNLR